MNKQKIKQLLFYIVRIIGRLIYKKSVWLVSDRAASAGDNGEAFFRFINEKKNVNSIFAIKRSSDDYDRISRAGKVVEYESLKYKLLLCVCDCHISSQLLHMENHVETKQIFLQHGVAVNNISKMLNPFSHENLYIVVSSEAEYQNFSSSDYKIRSNNILKTGLPRFDSLRNNPMKKIVIAFTWRAELWGKTKEEIKRTDYYKTIVKLMTDESISGVLSSLGYKLYIKLHPEMNSIKDILPFSASCELYINSYNKMFEEACLMITDYSSSIFDFIYLNKPVIYYQFDNGKYYDNPFTGKGHFDYEKEGFGPVCYTHESLKKSLFDLIYKGCVIDEKYRNRAASFFLYYDTNNCERVYQSILSIIGGEKGQLH